MSFSYKINSQNIINLESLLEFSAKLNQKSDSGFILNSSLLSLMGKLKIGKGAAFIKKGAYLVPLFSKGNLKLNKIKCFDCKGFSELEFIEGGEELQSSGFKYCLPIIYNNDLLSLLVLGNRLVEEEFSAEEAHYADLVGVIAANALQNASANLSLIEAKNNAERRNQLLTTMFEMSREFNIPMNRDKIIRMMSLRIMGQLMVSRFGIFLKDAAGDYDAIVNRFEYLPSADALNQLSQLDRTIKLSDLKTCCAIEEYLMLVNARVISPLTIGGKNKGLLIVGKKMNGDAFTEENIQFLEALANTAVSALENERLFHEELEKKKIESDLNVARSIQAKLLPDSPPQLKGYSISAYSEPSRYVGGDYYDFIKLDEYRHLVVIADVSGKGTPAALIMANFQAALHTIAPFIVSLKLTLNDIINRLSSIVYMNTESDRFITSFIGILNHKTNEFEYINAGHNHPFHINSKVYRTLSKGGLILGILDYPLQYESEIVKIESGDAIVLYTDGVSEAQSPEGIELGEQGVRDAILKSVDKDSAGIKISILNTIKEFTSNAPLYDDLTLIVIKRS